MAISFKTMVGAAAIALVAGVHGAQACVVSTAPANAGPAVWPALPIACSVIAPMFVSAVDGRELEEKEIWATTLTCFTGPIGYAIAIEKGWIGPCDRHRKRQK